MKKLSLISFVGIDTQTNLTDLVTINHNAGSIPCEWSVLYSDTKSKGNYARYPSYDFCKSFLGHGYQSKSLAFSLHLCGSVIDRYLKQEQDIMDLCDKALRIQLNLNIHNYPDHEKLSNDILNVAINRNHIVILQQNKTKEKFMEVFLKKATKKKFGLLYDGSGGFGRVITQIDPPDNFHITGYAGGINPENVAAIVDLIEKNNPDNRPYYIDMESGVRENNIFSLDKCQQVISNLM